jgi:phosphoribosylglycinamide formyltransferase-1
MNTERPKIIVFASGSKDPVTNEESGGSGFENLVKASRNGTLPADIIAVASNRANGKVKERAERLRIPFIHFPQLKDEDEETTRRHYREVVIKSGANWIALSGWLKRALGLPPDRTINIHPGPLPKFGGKDYYGHKVHEAVIAAYERGEVTHSAVTMHFVDEVYDRGPKFFEMPVPILKGDDADSLAKRVNAVEHEWQPFVTWLVVSGQISWDGKDPSTLKKPARWLR